MSRHRLALVLGSGGVRSVAALGIVDALARHGIRPDLVVGCSSGALFGAVIASGMAPAEGLALSRKLWSQELTERHNRRAWLQLLMPRLARFNADFALRDSSLIGQRIESVFGTRRIEALPLALRIATTDASSGEPVLLSRGALAPALRASMAVPLVFPPVHIDGQRLIDGVASDPLPVAAALDASVVLTLGFAGRPPRRIDRPSRLVAHVSTMTLNNLMRARLDAAAARGQRIVPFELALDRHVGLWQTDALPELFEAGQRAARARLCEVETLLRHDPRAAT
ncbi:patatin-like phospholipase family protein [Piscinibacter sp.]|uniref:patatin-like phospholipase family protein n=1 Tax=Piscinibacter sp. TaxID=1903157 RepID=UPI0039E23A5A